MRWLGVGNAEMQMAGTRARGPPANPRSAQVLQRAIAGAVAALTRRGSGRGEMHICTMPFGNGASLSVYGKAMNFAGMRIRHVTLRWLSTCQG
jgi:hypothetical protein